jgi:hypothetical protein
MWQGLTVGMIVLVATAYAIWALVPAGTRLRLASRLSAWSRRAGRPAWLGHLAVSVERSARSRIGGCTDCGTASPPTAARSKRRVAQD